MTWIVKANGTHPYLCAEGPGSCWAPDLSDAKRYATHSEAFKVASETSLEAEVGACVRVVKLRPGPRETAVAAARDYVENFGGDTSADRKRFRAMRDALARLEGLASSPPNGNGTDGGNGEK